MTTLFMVKLLQVRWTFLVLLMVPSWTAGTEDFCPKRCLCQGGAGGTLVHVDCTGRNLTQLPAGLSNLTTHLDLSLNNITKLSPHAFKGLHELRELRLTGNKLFSLPDDVFSELVHLRSLHLMENNFKKVPSRALRHLRNLDQLRLGANQISDVPDDSFSNMPLLRHLRLDTNLLESVPITALNKIPNLQALTLAVNKIEEIPKHAFENMSKLEVLVLRGNKINKVHHNAFDGLRNLKVFELDRNNLRRIPSALSTLVALQQLWKLQFQLQLNENEVQVIPQDYMADQLTSHHLSANNIRYVRDNSFIHNQKLTTLGLNNNPIVSVGIYAFANLPYLQKLVLSELRDQHVFPNLTGTVHLDELVLDRANIKSIAKDLCIKLPRLMLFDIHSNKISRLPSFTECHVLKILNLRHNLLRSVESSPFRGLSELGDLILSHNYIETITMDAFIGLNKLQYLDLEHNKISRIDSSAFLPLKSLENLNVGENYFSELPTKGLQNLKKLKTFNNRALQDFPGRDAFPEIQYLVLSYAYHCCQFLPNEKETDESQKGIVEEHITFINWPNPTQYQMNLWRNISVTDRFIPSDNNGGGDDRLLDDIYDEVAGYAYDYEDYYNDNYSDSNIKFFEDYTPMENSDDFFISKQVVTCKPMPGPFMPCDDLMGWWSLRCGVWLVFLLALLGNGTVLIVITLSRTKMDVPRFLICNLASADFMMGIYIGFLAIVDTSTLGEFKKHAIKWQISAGCQIAGFLGVLSSELSVFTLTVITLERFYAITHAMNINKRLSLRHAGYVVGCGWVFSTILALLPLFGISDYRKFAVCLPFETGDGISLGYVCFIMILNCTAFIIIVSCYTKMYCSIRGSQAWNSNDTRIAKRMAILVFTDFACWAPISFFSITAAFGLDILSLNDAKVFTIFVLPLNSCANPFLYAIFTKQFKKDCSLICKRMEDAAMKRHFSKMSNKNHSLTWGSSRHPSALNSFFNTHDMRMRRINMPYHSRNIVYISKPTVKDKVSSGESSTIPFCSTCCEDYGEQNMSGHRTNTGVNDSDMSCDSNSSCACPCHTEVRGQKVMEQGKGLFLKLMQKRRHRYKYNLDSVSGEGDVDSDPNLNLFAIADAEEKPCDSTGSCATAKSNKFKLTARGRSRSMNCCSGLSGDVCQSPGGAAYDFSGSLSAPEASNTDPAEPSAVNMPSDTSCSVEHSNSGNNNHEYINVTDDMISELRHMCIPSSPDGNNRATKHHRHRHQRRRKTRCRNKKIDPPDGEQDIKVPPSQARADPEGCESEETNPVNMTLQTGGSMTYLSSCQEHYLPSCPDHISKSKSCNGNICASPPSSSIQNCSHIDEDDVADTVSASYPLLPTKKQYHSMEFKNCANDDDFDASLPFLTGIPRAPSLQNCTFTGRSFLFNKKKSKSDQL